MSIVDIHGSPIRLEREPQTENDSMLGLLRRHYSEHPTVGLTPGKAAAALLEAELGNMISQCELAEDMEEKDAHLQSELGKRRRSLLSVPWTIKPPRNPSAEEQRDADLLTELLEDFTWFEDCIFDATDAILKGFSAQEFTGWEQVEGLMLPKGLEWRDPAWFQTHPDDRNQLRLRDGTYEGAVLNPFGWVVHNAKSKSGYLARTGLIRTLVWPFLFKNYSVRDLAEFLEIYGLPVRLGKYPEGATDKEKTTLLNAVLSIGHNAGGIIPRGMEIEFQNAASGQADPFVVMMDWCERSMSKAILGGTLTSQADGKSSTNALGNVHNEVRMEVRDSDLHQLAATLTRDLIYPLYALNGKSFQSTRRLPRIEFDTTEPEDMRDLAYPLRSLVSMGMKIPAYWVQEKLQIPKAKDTDEVLKIVDGQNNQNEAMLKARVKGIAALSAAQPDNTDLQILQLSKQASTVLSGMTKQVQQLVMNATSLDEIRDGLLEIEPDISPDELGELLAQAITASELLGMLEVQEGR
ncbi:protein of unknown function DUF935 [Tolumonas auensis DSM 9187]|uniref:Mu-like prophage FluMu protein gp29 n=1 Tax=Tolumonas auensis (strain DSM 9187 / NBRC 110442 / TA 4) TaxID=595494 RepID=C4LBD2_TOLAT|nr:DUF935 domain-containing protein [Tolumonas auensis]ACQ92367.1 protein of unknown function DUF935 [Tolumonas auensis DSM 9187]